MFVSYFFFNARHIAACGSSRPKKTASYAGGLEIRLKLRNDSNAHAPVAVQSHKSKTKTHSGGFVSNSSFRI